ncbi:MAG: hypothetical protein JWM91_4757 [Rhodospirillales bacterium]|nr:hypothetical protein [Rhodospirillales bacterium]
MRESDFVKIEAGRPLTEGYQPVQKGYQARAEARPSAPPTGGSSAIPPAPAAPAAVRPAPPAVTVSN